jgi:hypothetical protein
MMSEDYLYQSAEGGRYERVTNIAGVKTTICHNRFEIVCRDRADINEQQVVADLKEWIAKQRPQEV